MGNYTIFGWFENPRRGRQARNLTTNVRKILKISNFLLNGYFPRIVFGCPCEWSNMSLLIPEHTGYYIKGDK